MPKIIEYRTQVNAPGAGSLNIPTASGAAFGANTARAQQDLGGAVRGLAVSARAAEEKKDLSRIQVGLANARSEATLELTRQVSEGLATGEDFNSNFNNLVAEKMDLVREGVTTPVGHRSLDVASANVQTHFAEQSAIAKATAEGELAKDNFIEAQQLNDATLISDPLQFESILEETQQALNDPKGPYAAMPVEVRRDLQRQAEQDLAVSAVQGTIRNMGPEVAEDLLASGKLDGLMDGATKKALLGAVDTAKRTKKAEITAARVEADRLKNEAEEKINVSFIDRLLDPEGEAVMPSEIQNSVLGDRDKLAWASYFERQNDRAETRIDKANKISLDAKFNDSAVFNRLAVRVNLPENDPNKIRTKMELLRFVGFGINLENDMPKLLKEIDNARDPLNRTLNDRRQRYLTANKRMVTKGNDIINDPQGDVNFYMLGEWLWNQEELLKSQNKDPFGLYDPTSSDFVTQDTIGKMFTRSATEVMNEKVRSLSEESDKIEPVFADIPKSAPTNTKGKKLTPTEFLEQKKKGG